MDIIRVKAEHLEVGMIAPAWAGNCIVGEVLPNGMYRDTDGTTHTGNKGVHNVYVTTVDLHTVGRSTAGGTHILVGPVPGRERRSVCGVAEDLTLMHGDAALSAVDCTECREPCGLRYMTVRPGNAERVK